ncbi:hypothetical protein [Sphaerothrix gracilis]|uniref:hypothetical protein n=1 Tax=Sphaerothrix gracilis TaxID=3151835 RepID=UPI0031FE2FE4
MAFFRNPANESKGAPYATLGGKIEEQNVKAEFSDLRFVSDDENVTVYAYFTKFSEVVVEKEDGKWNRKDLPDEVHSFSIRSSGESLVEKSLFKFFKEELSEDKNYSGRIDFSGTPTLSIYLSGKNEDGEEVDDNVIKTIILPSLIKCKEVEPSGKIDASKLKVRKGKKGGGNWSNAASQSAKEAYAERYAIFCELVGAKADEGLLVASMQLKDLMPAAEDREIFLAVLDVVLG